MPENLDRHLEARLQQREVANLYRHRLQLETAQNTVVQMDGRTCVAFCSNDYLGLAAHPAVIDSFVRAAETYGVGSGASHLICGHSHEHHALEEELADFTQRPRALLFSSGYMANLGVITTLVDKGDHVFEDRLNHASLLDGGLSSGARFQRYHHNSKTDLDRRLQRLETGQKGNRLVVTDGVFSMDGDEAPLPDIAATCQRYQGWLMVDDAHGFGVLGESGGGCVEQHGLSVHDVPILVGTLGKAFGTSGAFVAGSEALIESLIQFARSYIYTTALPPAVAAATRISLKILRREHWRRQALRDRIAQFRKGVDDLGLRAMPSTSPIQPVLIGDDALCIMLCQSLRQRGFLVGAVRPPTVPPGTARLRITLCAEHTQQQVDDLINVLGDQVQQLPADQLAMVKAES